MQTKSFCYVDDLVECIIRMMNSSEGITGPVNLGNPGEYTMLELAEKELDWGLTIGLDEGLKRTIEYFKMVV